MNYLHLQITQKALSPSSPFSFPINYWNPVPPLAQRDNPEASFNANTMKWTLALNGMLFCFSNLIDVSASFRIVGKVVIIFISRLCYCTCHSVCSLFHCQLLFCFTCCYIIAFLPSGEMIDMVILFYMKNSIIKLWKTE